MEKARGRTVFLDWEPPPRKWLVSLDDVALRAGQKLVARGVQLAVARDARIHVTGKNGAGKSTLLNTLVAAAAIPSERLLYLPQEIAADEGAALAHEIARMPRDAQGRVGQLVAALGLDPSRALSSSLPSPGEVRKLSLALGLARRVWLVVLDEPTNAGAPARTCRIVRAAENAHENRAFPREVGARGGLHSSCADPCPAPMDRPLDPAWDH